MKTKKFFSIVCLTVALSVNSLPVHAEIPWELAVEVLKFMNSPVAQHMLSAITAPKPNEYPAYADDEWLVTFEQDGKDIIYYGVNIKTKNGIKLRNVTVQSYPQRRVFSWNNGGTIYQIAYQPNDPDFVRLQVFEGKKQLLNRLLRRYVRN